MHQALPLPSENPCLGCRYQVSVGAVQIGYGHTSTAVDINEGSSCNSNGLTVVKHLEHQLSGIQQARKWPKFYVVPTVDDGLKRKMSVSTLLKGTRLYLLKTERSWVCWIYRVEARVFIVCSICDSESFAIFKIQVKRST